MSAAMKFSSDSQLSSADRGQDQDQDRELNPMKERTQIHGDSLASALIRIEELVMQGKLEKAAALVGIAHAIAAMPGIEGAMIAFCNAGELVCCASSGNAPAIGARLSARSGLYHECLTGGRMIRRNDGGLDLQVDGPAEKGPSGSVILLPLVWGRASNGVLAVFAAANSLGNEYITALGTAAALASLLASELETNSLQEPVPQQAVPVVAPFRRDSVQWGSDIRPSDVTQALLDADAVSETPVLIPPADGNLRSRKTTEEPMTQTEPADTLIALMRRQSADERSSHPSRKTPRISGTAGLIAVLVLCSCALLAAFHSVRQEPKPVQAGVASSTVVKFDVTTTMGRPILGKTNSSRSADEITGGTSVQAPLPVYPQVAIVNGVKGDISAMLLVSETGIVTDVLISNGDATLAQSAAAKLAHWRYAPFRVAGDPVSVEIPVTVSFRLNHETK